MTLLQATVPVSHPPGYYIRRRLWRNRPAMTGLAIISLATLVAILGYLVLPDDTPDANHTIVQLQKRPPGFSAEVIRLPAGEALPQRSWLTRMLFGQPRNYTEYP